ncbi:hypothetical protein DYB37_008501 [Aphanomyces astaci]|uniref:Uncharacterized protein n=1 Tax=Aphanomyces astaci TaxID=112090 RepID=A0A3R6ZW73_APHAT|nr:hypothetical protein DYB35_013507 [Aphanomyces astaci]RHZ21903.1 hypothetical protein DYB37_008501 [Aphanomyces astaci]
MEPPRRGRFLAKDPAHANSDNIRGIFGTLPLAAMLQGMTDMGGSMTTLATQTIDRLETAMRHLEDMYGYVTNADLQGHARSSMLTELGSVILEATKAADATIALFHDTYAVA